MLTPSFIARFLSPPGVGLSPATALDTVARPPPAGGEPYANPAPSDHRGPATDDRLPSPADADRDAERNRGQSDHRRRLHHTGWNLSHAGGSPGGWPHELDRVRQG